MTVKQIKESALRLFDNDEVSRRKVSNLTKLNSNIEVRSRVLNDFINESQTELEQLSDLKIKTSVELHNTENKLN
jgi:hypothetical protein